MEKVFVHPECPFSENTFKLLAEFYENPSSDFYMEHKKHFLKYVEAPLKYIFSQVEELLPDFIKKYIKSKWERSGAIIETNGLQLIAYSVALGFEELNSLDDAQLTLRFENQKLTFGFCAGREYIEAIMDNYKCNYRDSIEAIKILNLYHLPHQHHVCLTPAIMRIDSEWPEICNILMTPQKSVKGLLRSLTNLADQQPEEVTLYKITYMQVAISLESKQVLRYSAKQLSYKIAQTFKQVFPLFLCCNLNDNQLPLVITQYFSFYEKELNREYDF
jgi:5-methylcytosine-specific restriction protein B